jgi:hypothetical protein
MHPKRTQNHQKHQTGKPKTVTKSVKPDLVKSGFPGKARELPTARNRSPICLHMQAPGKPHALTVFSCFFRSFLLFFLLSSFFLNTTHSRFSQQTHHSHIYIINCLPASSPAPFLQLRERIKSQIKEAELYLPSNHTSYQNASHHRPP